MSKVIGYVRVSDANKQSNQAQRTAIEDYANKTGLIINEWIEESISASKTEIEDRQLNQLRNQGHIVICSDITRLGRRKVFELLGLIGELCKNGGELHLAYTNRVVNESNIDDAETIFVIVGGSFASVEEAKKRSDRATAGHKTRKANGLHSGRKVGQVVKSKLDDYKTFIINSLNAGMTKVDLLEKLNEKDLKVSRAQLYRWIEKNNNQIL
jgi:Site-specific recombinases, DNA invertase Pin homologs